MSSFTVEGNSDLSTSHINRLLRPLRNRCNNLAAFSSTAARLPTIHATYSSRATRNARVFNSNRESEVPPLSILQPPQTIRSQIHLDQTCVSNLELSQKLYAVRDSFRDLVVKTATRLGSMPARDRWSITSLSAMCSIIVGENIHPDFNTDTSDGMEEEELIDAINDIYEAVPLQYRRWTLVAHALDIVLHICPHYPTLLSILLDVCLAHKIVHQSNTLLRALLLVATSPVSIACSVPRLCHLAHSTYLTNLREKWSAHGRPDRGFVRILVDVLVDVRSPEAWSCKAVNKLAHLICSRDFSYFMHMIGGLTETIANIQLDIVVQRKRRSRKVGSDGCGQHENIGLTDRLLKWLNLGFDHLFTSPRRPQTVDLDPEFFQFVLDFFQLVRSLGMHIYAAANERAAAHLELPGTIICLATRCLSHPAALTSDPQSVIDLLREVIPTTSTYSSLIAQIFAPKPTCPPSIVKLDDCKETVRAHADALRSYRLLHLEASIWACALRHVELSEGERLVAVSASDKEVGVYRRELISLVDDAENRCFGFGTVDKSIGLEGRMDGHCKSTRHRQCGEIQNPSKFWIHDGIEVFECEWEWEAMVGCWIRKSTSQSVRKMAKFEHDHALRFSRRLLARNVCRHDDSLDHPESATSSQSILSSSQAPSSGPVMLLPELDEGSWPEDGGKDDCRHSAKSNLASNFTTLLADALSNQTVLHPNQKMTDNLNTSSQLHRTCSVMPSPLSPVRKDDFDHNQTLPSDDALDLFACSSSP